MIEENKSNIDKKTEIIEELEKPLSVPEPSPIIIPPGSKVKTSNLEVDKGVINIIPVYSTAETPATANIGDIAVINNQLKIWKDSNPSGTPQWMSLCPITVVGDIIVGDTGGVPRAIAASGTNKELTINGSGVVAWATRVLSLIQLTDCPVTYSGKALKGVRVNSGATGLEFAGVGSYVEIAPPAWSAVGSTSTWEDWDLSGSIPAGASYAEILIWNEVDWIAGVRKNGSAVERKMAGASVAKTCTYHMTVELDANRVCERYGEAASVLFTVVGYWL